jgi:hypothetical protein
VPLLSALSVMKVLNAILKPIFVNYSTDAICKVLAAVATLDFWQA